MSQQFLTKDYDYLTVLKALRGLPFSVGKNLLIDYLRGSKDNESIVRNKLFRLPLFSGLELYSKSEVRSLIDMSISRGFLSFGSLRGKPWKVLLLTERGSAEIENPTKSMKSPESQEAVTAQEKEAFSNFGSYLERYNDFQKKAIISNNSRLLCIAGAGTGKTTVLTKRIEFLVQYRSVKPRKILAITFTKKAREEMQARLGKLSGIHVHTFNSFCERQLKNFSDVIYGRKVRMITVKERIELLSLSLEKAGVRWPEVFNLFYKNAQDANLRFQFMNDCFSVRDMMKSDGLDLGTIKVSGSDPVTARCFKVVKDVVSVLDEEMKQRGLRDYSDQLVDCIGFFRKNPEYIPRFDHILVDEYQDINRMQRNLIAMLDPKNMFCVGDPRQAIFGWRGSRIEYILDFHTDNPGSEIISLRRNYRSAPKIVEVSNISIRDMQLPDLEPHRSEPAALTIRRFGREDEEFAFAAKRIQEHGPCCFVLARTNKQLKLLSEYLSVRGIAHFLKTDSSKENPRQVPILATIHSIKGMESDHVVLMGCSARHFPCRYSENRVFDTISFDNYDKYEEERRLFYVGLTRARKGLDVTYVGTAMTRFITAVMERLLREEKR